jgi:hypothetical protein
MGIKNEEWELRIKNGELGINNLPFCGVAFFLIFKEILCVLCETLCVKWIFLRSADRRAVNESIYKNGSCLKC